MNRLDEHNQYDIQLISSTGAIKWQQEVRGDDFSDLIYRIPVSALFSRDYILFSKDTNYKTRVRKYWNQEYT